MDHTTPVSSIPMVVINCALYFLYQPTSCRDLNSQDKPTGEYTIFLPGTETPVRVWCEMALGTGGGGYTFVHPTQFYILSPENQKALLNQIYTHTGDVLLRVRKHDGKQPYSVLQQLTSRTYVYLLIPNL